MEYFRQRFIDDLNDEGPVAIRGFEWPNVDVFKLVANDLYEGHFVDWLGSTKEAARDRAREFLTDNGCLPRFNRLSEQCKQQQVMPFVGAGLSRSTGFPLWGDFLRSLTDDFAACRPDLDGHLAAGHYEEAAQLMRDRMGNDVFDEALLNIFGHRQKAISGPIQLLPMNFRRGVITTNFDYTLETIYEDAGFRFDGTLAGSRLKEAPRLVARQPHCLLRLHGEADTSDGRVLTLEEYEASYGVGGIYQEILGATINATSLLFLGCSLGIDRTINALAELKLARRVATPRHYAFLPLTEGLDREARLAELVASDIYPIWYPPEDHDQAIEDLLISLMEGGFHD